MFQAGEAREAAPLIAEAMRAEPRWEMVIDRLVASERMTESEAESLRSLLGATRSQ